MENPKDSNKKLLEESTCSVKLKGTDSIENSCVSIPIITTIHLKKK